MSFFAQRLKEARRRSGFSQERLGIEAGLDPMSASTRMNRYELGKRVPDLELVARIAEVLGVPASFFYAKDDVEAELLLKFHRLSTAQKLRVVALVDELAAT
ncbi:helix-turn-helix domain-containing protein [Burkholderia ubonensis]|uniref:helix-turn-helix domain-containing protein n=1 Tax=Burkholderia ubonensis TaxID=101571 RepID=UPI0007597111|nr:helix-turn-helix transcriptional regulator [Burkholderia ubonensis]AOI72061.1 transcriptional regulator [Burkholderia ubonensis]KUZ25698.1 transcriptional regulator [Burkholderia ubonensis]KUZ26065.1 transcriptional regulator [Burkholderia ubonensis]KUZ27854.1 transcriptional regulator [Burkholderia ubonensis]KUZ57788.1 transcriptional regulator [Burkholderia ubonensis]